MVPTPRYLIKPTYENFERELENRKDPNFTYEKYLEEWEQEIHKVVDHYIKFETDKLTGKTNPTYTITSGVPVTLPDSSQSAYENTKKEKGLDSYSYEAFLEEWKDKVKAVARDYTSSEKQRYAQEAAMRKVALPVSQA